MGLNRGRKLLRSDLGIGHAAMCHREVRNDRIVFTAKWRVLGKVAYETLRELDERLCWFRSQVRGGGETSHLRHTERKGGNCIERLLHAMKHDIVDPLRRHERHQGSDVRGHAELDRSVIA